MSDQPHTDRDYGALVAGELNTRLPIIQNALARAQFGRSAHERMTALHQIQQHLFVCASIVMEAMEAELRDAPAAGVTVLAEAARKHTTGHAR